MTLSTQLSSIVWLQYALATDFRTRGNTCLRGRNRNTTHKPATMPGDTRERQQVLHRRVRGEATAI